MATLRIVMSAWRGRSRRGSSCALAQEAVPDTTQRAWLLLGRLVSGTGKYKG